MNIVLWIAVFVASLVVLLKASDYFIAAAERIGLALGISPFVVGVTIVAAGTSLPELVTSVVAVLNDTSEIVVGNVIGSNIANILLVLGLTLVISKSIQIKHNIGKIDLPFLLLSVALFVFFTWDYKIVLWEAIAFVGMNIVYLIVASRQGKVIAELDSDNKSRNKAELRDYLFLLGGAAGIWLGASYTVESVIKLSEIMQIGSDKIALTAVALGTSLPELMVSLAAGRKGSSEIVVGNVLGSNIFNTLLVMGVPGFMGSLLIPEDNFVFSIPVMVIATVLFTIFAFSRKLKVWQGWLFFIGYIAFMSYLILSMAQA